MSELFDGVLKQQEEVNKNKTKKEQSEAVQNLSVKLLETITGRHRLINAALETEVLTKIYKKQADEMGFEEYHLFMRSVQFEYAKYKDNAGQPPPVFINEINSEDTSIDRYVPNNLCLAMHEIEETQIGGRPTPTPVS